MAKKTRAFVTGGVFQPSLMFVGKAKSLLYKETPESFDANIKLGWERLSGDNTLDYWTDL